MSAERHDCGPDVAAYAIGALEDAEARAFAHHLDDCIVCRDELLAFRQVIDALPLAAPSVAPPARLRRRVLAEARRDLRRHAAAARGTARPGRRRAGSRAAWMPGPLLRPAGALAGAAVIALAIAGGAEFLHGAPGVRVLHAAVGHATVRIAGDRGELVVNHLPQPSSGHIYEVWLVRRGDAQPEPTSALFDVTTAGTGSVDVPGRMDGVSQIMVTEERAGGSLVPHGPAVIVAPTSS